MDIHVDLGALRRRVELEIEAYTYCVPESSLGLPWTAERVSGEIERFKSGMVTPYWVNVELRDTVQEINAAEPVTRTCVVVADELESGVIVLFDPIQDEFVLGQRNPAGITTFGVRGDAVGCFMAR